MSARFDVYRTDVLIIHVSQYEHLLGRLSGLNPPAFIEGPNVGQFQFLR
jgi:hypothetical protein